MSDSNSSRLEKNSHLIPLSRTPILAEASTQRRCTLAGFFEVRAIPEETQLHQRLMRSRFKAKALLAPLVTPSLAD